MRFTRPILVGLIAFTGAAIAWGLYTSPWGASRWPSSRYETTAPWDASRRPSSRYETTARSDIPAAPPQVIADNLGWNDPSVDPKVIESAFAPAPKSLPPEAQPRLLDITPPPEME